MTEYYAPVSESRPYPSDALDTGTRLEGYWIESILGRGAFGITYLAVEKRLDRLVAIKEYLPMDIATRRMDHTVHPRTGSHEDLFQYGLESFLKEAKTLVKFKHNNIVSVLNYFEHYETAYLVMEYEVGQQLHGYFKEHPALSERELLEIFLPVNEGLAVVHQHGFIHRDIKPDNIYIRNNQSPVLLDFGAARNVVKTKADNLTRILTEGYAPYEQDNPAWADQGPWTDIYALGATLYMAVIGDKPVSASSRAAAFMMKSADPYTSASAKADKKYSPAFLAAIDKALEFHPQDRPQSLTEWNQMLNGRLSDATVIMPPSGSADSDATVIMPSPNAGTGHEAYEQQQRFAEQQAHVPSTGFGRRTRVLLSATVAMAIILAVIVGRYYLWNSDEPAAPSSIPEHLASSALIYGKTACWHYARMGKFKALNEKIKALPSTSDRTRFLADQMKKINEAEKGFEKNFSQYSIAIIRLRRYPVDAINQAIQYFLQAPDYIDDRAYNTIATMVTEHATGGILSTETWKDDFIRVSVNSPAFAGEAK